MVEHKDIFAPCLKLKNKVVLRHDKEVANLLKQSENTSTSEKLKSLIMGKLKEEVTMREMPNFTCQADFALNQTA